MNLDLAKDPRAVRPLGRGFRCTSAAFVTAVETNRYLTFRRLVGINRHIDLQWWLPLSAQSTASDSEVECKPHPRRWE